MRACFVRCFLDFVLVDAQTKRDSSSFCFLWMLLAQKKKATIRIRDANLTLEDRKRAKFKMLVNAEMKRRFDVF